MDSGGADAPGSAFAQFPGPTEYTYRLLAGYGFARRLVAEKTVADVRLKAGPETDLLAQSAGSVVCFSLEGAPKAPTRALPTQPKTRYETAGLPELPSPSGSFDVMVALEVLEGLESPETLVIEAKRVLREGSVLVVSVSDRSVRPSDDGMLLPELRSMLSRHFARVGLYRAGAVAGGLVFDGGESTSAIEVESSRLSYSALPFGSAPPNTSSILAVCSDAELPRLEPYLLLDQDGSVFEESGRERKEAELLREEVRQMQETEVRAFAETLATREDQLQALRSQIADLRARLRASEDRAERIERRLRLIENSRGWRALQTLRRLRPGKKDGG